MEKEGTPTFWVLHTFVLQAYFVFIIKNRKQKKKKNRKHIFFQMPSLQAWNQNGRISRDYRALGDHLA